MMRILRECIMKLALVVATSLALAVPVMADEMALAPMALNSLSEPPANLATAQVMNQSGQVIGTFQRVVSDLNGKPAAISYLTPEGKLVVVAAPAVSYDGQRNILVTADSPQLLASR
jgi:hypothetical protein